MSKFVVLLSVAVVLYVVFFVGTIYYCLYADPRKDPIAKFVSVTLPAKLYDAFAKSCGSWNLQALNFVAERLLILIYCAVVFGAWSVVFFYIFPWVDSQPESASQSAEYVPHYHKAIGYVTFAACVLSWRYASTTSPGIITKQSLHRYSHYPYDELLFPSGKTCKTRHIPKVARSKFDRYKYLQNVPRFDHFCGWVYNTIGEENYRFFLLFLVVHVVMCVYGTIITSRLFYGEAKRHNLIGATFVDRMTGQEYEATTWILVQFLFHTHLPEAAVLLLMGVMAVALGIFLMYHVYLTSYGMTTNESYKWSAVKKWHKKQTKRYRQALKNGEIVIVPDDSKINNDSEDTSQKSSFTVSDDADVTCTPSADGSKSDQGLVKDDHDCVIGHCADEDIVRDPGPMPRNIYDRGFIENWKEVLFPISLRSERSFEVKRGTKTKNT